MGIDMTYPSLIELAQREQIPLLVVAKGENYVCYDHIHPDPLISYNSFGVLVSPLPRGLRAHLVREDTVLVDLVGHRVITGFNRLHGRLQSQEGMRVSVVLSQEERLKQIQEVLELRGSTC